MEIDIHASNGIATRDQVFERPKPVLALDSAANLIGHQFKYDHKNIYVIVKTHFMERRFVFTAIRPLLF
jgi:hypothetical protein